MSPHWMDDPIWLFVWHLSKLSMCPQETTARLKKMIKNCFQYNTDDLVM